MLCVDLFSTWANQNGHWAGPAIGEQEVEAVPWTLPQRRGTLQSRYTCVYLLSQEDTGERRTTPDDLQGFWDMVSHQIDDVQHKFRQLEQLEKNNWVVERDVPKKKPMKVCITSQASFLIILCHTSSAVLAFI